MTNVQAVGIVPAFELKHRLRLSRELTGLDGQTFANEIGISDTGLYNAENGHSRPREITLRAWALRSGVDLQWLKTGVAPSHDGDGATSLVHPPGLEPGTNWHATRFAQEAVVTSIDEAPRFRPSASPSEGAAA